MKILFDSNVVLDFTLHRQPGFMEAEKIWRASVDGSIAGFVSASSVTDIFYIASNGGKKPPDGYFSVSACLGTLTVCSVDRAILDQAVAMQRPDFEDSVQIAVALAEGLDAIVTHDIKGFKNAGIKLYTPAQLVKELRLR